ncbi:beta-1,3-galactosyltransferase 2-like [Anomaloglossus baeobatrachus]|uniref:beta-1,3-galactosyltransferase 2-like n=1 Tax=Anomaloglossus baeobatrachus TaxID=238106 RepID=UPI003F503322
MNGRIPSRTFCFALFLVLISLSGYVFYYERKIEHFTKWSQVSIKLQERKTPVNNLTYPAFKHPLAPPYPFPYKFIINQPDKCKKRRPYLVIMILGTCHDSESRQTIRETWGNVSLYNVDVIRVFLVGLPQIFPEKVQDSLEEENAIYGDIVQQDFIDTYYNLTLKTLMGMEWVTKFCPSASYVIKIDIDMFLNVNTLVHELLKPNVPVRENYFTGTIITNTGPLREKDFKWYVPEEVYPNDTYPPYCAGPGYVFSAEMAKKIYDVAQKIRVIPMEDVFMGICLYELQIPLTEPPQGKFNGHKMDYDYCSFKKVVTVHHYAGNELRDIWADFQALKDQIC